MYCSLFFYVTLTYYCKVLPKTIIIYYLVPLVCTEAPWYFALTQYFLVKILTYILCCISVLY